MVILILQVRKPKQKEVKLCAQVHLDESQGQVNHDEGLRMVECNKLSSLTWSLREEGMSSRLWWSRWYPGKA